MLFKNGIQAFNKICTVCQFYFLSHRKWKLDLKEMFKNIVCAFFKYKFYGFETTL